MIEGVILGCRLFAVIHWLKEAKQAGTREGARGVIVRILPITQLSDHLLLCQLFKILTNFFDNIGVLAEIHTSLDKARRVIVRILAITQMSDHLLLAH